MKWSLGRLLRFIFRLQATHSLSKSYKTRLKYKIKNTSAYGNHIFQRMEKTYRRSAPIDFRAVSCSWQSQMSSFNLDALHPALGDMNATGIWSIIQRSTSTSLCKKTHSAISAGWSFANCSFNLHFKWQGKLWLNGENILEVDFGSILLIWTLVNDHFPRLWRGFSKNLTWLPCLKIL